MVNCGLKFQILPLFLISITISTKEVTPGKGLFVHIGELVELKNNGSGMVSLAISIVV